MVQMRICTRLHPPKECYLQQHPHQLQLLQQLLPWQWQSEGLLSPRLAVRSEQGTRRTSPLATDFLGMHQ